MWKKSFRYFEQLGLMDCGPACLQMIAFHFGSYYSQEELREAMNITRNGVSFNDICIAAEKIGLKATPAKISIEQVSIEGAFPCVLHWNSGHFVVLYDVKKAKNKTTYLIADPSHGKIKVEEDIFINSWLKKDGMGFAVLFAPTDNIIYNSNKLSILATYRFLNKYFQPFKGVVLTLLLGLLLIGGINIALPFMTQAIVDIGIGTGNLSFIHLILISQLGLYLGLLVLETVRGMTLLQISSRISISIISDFLEKLMKLPMVFFDTKHIGDISQRVNDHQRIEDFLTGTSMKMIFSIFNMVVFSTILMFYNYIFLLIFLLGSILGLCWSFLFLKKRKDLDYKKFQNMSESQASIYEIISGMQEIKLNNCEKDRVSSWQNVQIKLFNLNIKSLSLEQTQYAGFSLIMQLKNLFISFFSATLVLDHQLSLGAMLSISFIMGQMNAPIEHLVEFIRQIQDTKISVDRLNEIHDKDNEETEKLIHQNYSFNNDINFHQVAFKYGGAGSPMVLHDLTFSIPAGKITAIVGSSGSGKSTLLKLLLKFYKVAEGSINFGEVNLNDISPSYWRSICGTVMQDGYIFSDTIEKNIALNDTEIDKEKLDFALYVSNLQHFVKKLPFGLKTKIGNTGTGLSGGQKQRILIARAVYKNPQILLFDEATSSLDSTNEKVIMNRLNEFFQGKTVLIVAHRLSTVKNADQIIVLDEGAIVEVGNHTSLTKAKGFYFNLVHNQLEIAA